MRYRTDLIRRYYNSIDESHLWLGMPNPKWRQIRYFVWNDEEERMIVKKHDRSIRNKTQLLKLLRREAPHHVYYTTSQFRNPAEVGPDPFSKSGRDKYIKKNAKRLARKEGKTKDKKRIKELMYPVSQWSDYGNAFIEQEMYFDVDYEMETFQESRKRRYDSRTSTNPSTTTIATRTYTTSSQAKASTWSTSDTASESRTVKVLRDDSENRCTGRKEKSGLHKGAAFAAMKMSRRYKKRLIKRIRKQGILLDYELPSTRVVSFDYRERFMASAVAYAESSTRTTYTTSTPVLRCGRGHEAKTKQRNRNGFERS